MPQIPQYESRVNPSGLGAGRGSSPADFGGQTASAVDQLGQVVTRLGEHMTAVRNQTRLTKVSAQTERELQSYSFELQNGTTDEEGQFVPPPDPRDHEKLFEERAKQLRDAAKAELNDDTLFAEYDAKFQTSLGRETLTLRKANIELQKRQSLADLSAGMDDLATIAAQGDARTRAESVAQAHQAVDTFVAAGIMDPVTGQKQKDAFDRELDVADVRRDMRTPEMALQNLLDPKKYPHLDPAERQQWTTTAVAAVDKENREKLAEQRRIDREAEKAKKELQSNTAKSGAELEAQGKLTVAWVTANRDNLDETDYRALLKSAAGDTETKSNPQLYASLRLRYARGQDISMEVNEAYLNGDITQKEFNALTGRQVPDDSPRKTAWYQDGEKFIGRVVRNNDLNPNPAVSQLQADLLDRWGEWADAHPEATPDEARREYKALAQEARLIEVENLQIGLPLPRLFTGNRSQMTRETLAQVAQQTEEAFAAGEMDESEYARQYAVMQQWISVIENTEQTTTAPAATKK